MSYGSSLFLSPQYTLQGFWLPELFLLSISLGWSAWFLFCSVLSVLLPIHINPPTVRQMKAKSYCWWQHHRNTVTHRRYSAVLRSVQEPKGEGRGNKMLLWRYTQACAGQKWCSNLQCFAEKLHIMRNDHSTRGFAMRTRTGLCALQQGMIKEKFLTGVIKHIQTR